MPNIYAKLMEMVENHQVGASIIVIAGDPKLCPTGTKLLVNEAGEIIEGYINKDVFIRIQNELLKIIQSKVPQSINIDIADLLNLSLAAQLTLFIDPIYPKTQLIILGGGHIALPLAKLGKFLDFQVMVVDDRSSFANFFRFGEADEVICEDFEKAIEQLTFDVNTFIVIVTRGHHYDKVCLGSVLKSPERPAYVGMIGSRKKISAIMNALQDEGISAEQLRTVHSPIGLDIGAQTPEEIAMSILTEIMMVKRYGESRDLEAKSLKDISLIRVKEEKN
ncbi:XdhC family protein [Desulfitobacterium sp. Sab5]|uniref:XdhC family protein n=1 Tax=Desulfitobacterium nosdiversum TaxID=3375356 RepID=UPI003CF8F816